MPLLTAIPDSTSEAASARAKYAIIGDRELAEGSATLRDMRTVKQEKVRLDELVKRLA
ncbi:hypothetical protein HYS54_05325 [Candidatus Micrarchaeota archaeon]|nr:hypothetical protein [Candidatus Micrarchaeota archaeon]